MPLVLSGTDGVSGVDGTASNPAIEGTDSNTGIFYPAADTVAIGTGGTERLRVDSSGNLLVGQTSTPAGWGVSPRVSIKQSSTSGGAGFVSFSSANENAIAIGYDSGNSLGLIQVSYGTTGSFTPLAFSVGGSERMRLDASGNLLVNATSNGGGKLEVKQAATNESGIWVYSSATDSNGRFYCDNSAVGIAASFSSTGSFLPIVFRTSATERARITSGGDLLVGKTAANVGVDGCEVGTNYLAVSRPAAPPLIVNRNTDDGTLVSFRQATVEEGTISVSGTTVSYNGGHLARWSQLLNSQRDESIVKGTVLSNLDEMCEWLDAEGNPLPNEQLNRTKVSDVEGDANVAGVFVNWDNDDPDNPYDMNIAMTGDMIIRIAQGITVQKGDLLMSAGDGTAKPQGDDIVRSKTVAKVTSNHVTCTYDDGSYCVPCVLMAC